MHDREEWLNRARELAAGVREPNRYSIQSDIPLRPQDRRSTTTPHPSPAKHTAFGTASTNETRRSQARHSASPKQSEGVPNSRTRREFQDSTQPQDQPAPKLPTPLDDKVGIFLPPQLSLNQPFHGRTGRSPSAIWRHSRAPSRKPYEKWGKAL